MMFPDPGFNEFLKFLRLLNEQICVGFCSHIGHVVIDLVSLAAALFKVGGEEDNRGPDCKFNRLKRGLVVAKTNDAVAFASDRNFRKL